MFNDGFLQDLLLNTEGEIVEKANLILSQVVARLDVTKEDGSSSHGSCFLYSDTFYMITCARILAQAKSLEIVIGHIRYPAKIAALDEVMNLAVIVPDGRETQTHSLPYLRFAAQVVPGSKIFNSGYLIDKTFRVSHGVVAKSTDVRHIIADCTSYDGFSGGPGVGKQLLICLGVIRRPFGATTQLIPPVIVSYFFETFPSVPQPKFGPDEVSLP
jgi:hypothetical protein